MVGHSSAERLKSFGIRTIGELAHTDTDFLQREFKSHGIQMWEYANGIDHSIVDSAKHELKGIGNSITLGEDINDFDSAKQVLLSLSETVSERLRNSRQLAQNITVEIKYSDFSSNSHQMPLFSPTNTTKSIYEASCQLFLELWNKRPLRLLGIRTGKLLPEDAPIQMNIFDFTETTTTSKQPSEKKSVSTSCKTNQDTQKRLQQLDAAVDAIRLRYGKNAIVRGSLLTSFPGDKKENSSKKN